MQKEQFKNMKNDIEDERRLLDRTVEKLQREVRGVERLSWSVLSCWDHAAPQGSFTPTGSEPRELESVHWGKTRKRSSDSLELIEVCHVGLNSDCEAWRTFSFPQVAT